MYKYKHVHWSITSHQSEWLSSKRQKIINAREGMEKREPSYPVGEKVNCCSYYVKQYEVFQKMKNRAIIGSDN